MIEFTALQAIVKSQALHLCNRYRPTYLCSDDNVRNAIEYAIGSSMRKRDAAGELHLDGAAFWAGISTYYREWPKVSSNYIPLSLVSITERRRSKHPRPDYTPPTHQFLKLEMF